jgi:hypothetical protein
MIDALRDDGDVHAIRAFSKVPRTVAKGCRASSTATASTSRTATPLPLSLTASRAIAALRGSRLLSSGGLSRTALALLSPKMSRQKEERRNGKSQQDCGYGL